MLSQRAPNLLCLCGGALDGPSTDSLASEDGETSMKE